MLFPSDKTECLTESKYNEHEYQFHNPEHITAVFSSWAKSQDGKLKVDCSI